MIYRPGTLLATDDDACHDHRYYYDFRAHVVVVVGGVELAAPCFNIDARKQDQDTGTTSSIAFKHVRLFLKNRFGDPAMTSRRSRSRRNGRVLDGHADERVRLAIRRDDKNKHYRDVSFRDVKKVFGMIKDGKLTVQLGKNRAALCKGDARECGRLLKLITTMKQAPSGPSAIFILHWKVFMLSQQICDEREEGRRADMKRKNANGEGGGKETEG